VRKNAALTVLSIHHNMGEQLLPDGPELMDKFIKVKGWGGGHNPSSSVSPRDPSTPSFCRPRRTRVRGATRS
jgi:hypothetical protein